MNYLNWRQKWLALLAVLAITFTCSILPAVGLEQNTNRAYNDYFNWPLPNAIACEQKCCSDPNCKAFTYNGRTCFLKNAVPNPTPESGYTSGVKGVSCCLSGTTVQAQLSAKIQRLYNVQVSNGFATLWAYVANTGSSSFGSTCEVWYYVNGPRGAQWVGPRSLSGLAAGTGYWAGLNWNIVNAPRGAYQYWARVFSHTGNQFTPISALTGPQSFTL